MLFFWQDNSHTWTKKHACTRMHSTMDSPHFSTILHMQSSLRFDDRTHRLQASTLCIQEFLRSIFWISSMCVAVCSACARISHRHADILYGKCMTHATHNITLVCNASPPIDLLNSEIRSRAWGIYSYVCVCVCVYQLECVGKQTVCRW